jgi:hypothetical protein
MEQLHFCPAANVMNSSNASWFLAAGGFCTRTNSAKLLLGLAGHQQSYTQLQLIVPLLLMQTKLRSAPHHAMQLAQQLRY